MIKYIHKNYILGAGEKAQQPRVAQAEDLGSILSTHTVSGDPVPSSDSKVHLMRRHTCRQNTHKHKITIKKS